MEHSEHKNWNQRSANEISLRELIEPFLYSWYWYLGVISICMALAYYYNWYVRPEYHIKSKIIIQETNRKSLGSNDFLLKELDIFKNQKIIDNEIEILKSISLIKKATAELEFDVSYILLGKVKTAELYTDCPFQVSYDTVNYYKTIWFYVTVLDNNKYSLKYTYTDRDEKLSEEKVYPFNELVNTPIGQFKLFKRNNFDYYFKTYTAKKDRDFKFKFNNPKSVANEYFSKLEVKVSSKLSTTLVLSVNDQVPIKGTDFLNKLVDVYILSNIEEKNKIARNTLAFIKDRIGGISGDLTSIESGLESYKTQNGITSISTEAKVFLDNVKEIDAQLLSSQVKLEVLDRLEKSIGRKEMMSQISPAVFGINDIALGNMINQLQQLEIEREKLVNTTRSDNPLILVIDKQIANTQMVLIQNVSNLKQSLLVEKQELEHKVVEIEKLLSKIPKAERELAGISRQQKIKENLYLFLLQKQEETSIALASEVSDCRIIDRAAASEAPVKPNKNLSYAIALLLGIILPTLIVIIKNWFNDTVNDYVQLQKRTNIPLLGVVGKSDNPQNTLKSTTAKTWDHILEQFRSIRTNLQYFISGKDSQIIMVTSSMSGEGKTFVALNIANTLALAGKKVLLIELDMRKPTLYKYINATQGELGLSSFLIAKATLSEIIKPTNAGNNLYTISSGPIPPNPAELLLQDRSDELFAELKSMYDYIIIDSPPVGMVSDAFIYGKYCSLIVYVVRQGVTKIEQIEMANKINEEKRFNHMSMILNDSTGKRNGYYGYAYGYYAQGLSEPTSLIGKIRKSFSKS